MTQKDSNPLVMCMIENLDDGEVFTVYENPAEISYDRSVSWQKHKDSKGDHSVMEFTNAEPMTLSCELFFDTYETKGNVYLAHISKLEKLTLVKQKARGEKKRPPIVLFTWGKALPEFKGVVESLSVKYTMFLPDGTPCRATATIKIVQADKARAKVRKKKSRNG